MTTWKEKMKQDTEYAQQFPQYIGNIAAHKKQPRPKKDETATCHIESMEANVDRKELGAIQYQRAIEGCPRCAGGPCVTGASR